MAHSVRTLAQPHQLAERLSIARYRFVPPTLVWDPQGRVHHSPEIGTTFTACGMKGWWFCPEHGYVSRDKDGGCLV